MMDVISAWFSEVVSFFVGLLGGSLLTIYVKSIRVSKKGYVADQSKATADGDIVGRDKIGK